MRGIVKILWFLFVISFFCSCVNKERTKHRPDFSSVRKIDISADISKDEIQGVIELDSYVPLSNEALIGEIKRVIIYNDLLYILDNEPKIVCFNMKGEVIFMIDCKGGGPTEFQNLKDFAIDGDSKRIIAFDNEKRRLFFYDMKTGKHISSISTFYMSPTEIAYIDSGFFFKNMDTRFDVQQNHQFYLLYSSNGEQIDTMFLPHNAVADFNFDLKSFFYNDGNLLFVRPFDNIVYALQEAGIIPIYEINLPNPLPMKKIKEKMRHTDIPKSSYSYGIGDVYVAGKTLHFTFAKDGFVVSTFFDLSTNTLLYNGIRVLGNARESLPFYSIINGVYEDKFFALVSASSIVERRTAHPEFFHGELSRIKEEDNAVLAYFSVNSTRFVQKTTQK
ncbi:MAG: 6-bladed beta-propeller [Candidatus Gastranaerophilales bacterium]|nr:6-bladed beta-propeller [Candidatus Gastranaerophilales bacterium]